MIAKYSQSEYDIPQAPKGVEPGAWDKELYEKASRFVKIDFKADKPVVTVYKKKSIIMNSPKMRNELYRNLKVALLGDIGRTLIEQYQQRFLEEEPAVIQREEWAETYSRMYEDVKEVIRRIVTHQPLWGGIADKDMVIADDLLVQLLDFQSDPAIEGALKEAKALVDQLQKTEDKAQQVEIQKQLEAIYNRLKVIKEPIAEQFRGLIQTPEQGKEGGVKHEKYFLSLDKKRRMEVLNILLNQLHLYNPPAHSGSTGTEVAQNLIYNPRDNWKFLKRDGVPTSEDTGTPNPNFGKDIDITQYPIEPIYRLRLKEILKDRLLRIVKEALIKNAALAYYTDEQGKTIPLSVADLRKDEIIDLTSGKPEYVPASQLKERKKKRSEEGLMALDVPEVPEAPESIASFKSLSRLRFAQSSDVIFIDASGNTFDTMQALLQANESNFQEALNMEMLEDVDDQLVEELTSEQVPEEEFVPEMAMAAEIYSRIVRVANEVSEKEEHDELLQVARSLKKEK